MSSLLVGSVGSASACLVLTIVAIISATVNTETMININWVHSYYKDSETILRHYVGVFASVYKRDDSRGIHVTEAVFYTSNQCSGDYCNICAVHMKIVTALLGAFMAATILSMVWALRRYYRSNNCGTKTLHICFSLCSVALGLATVLEFNNSCYRAVKKDFGDETFTYGLAFNLTAAAIAIMFVDLLCAVIASSEEDSGDKYRAQRSYHSSGGGGSGGCCCGGGSFAVAPSGSDLGLYPQRSTQQNQQEEQPYPHQQPTGQGLDAPYPSHAASATVGNARGAASRPQAPSYVPTHQNHSHSHSHANTQSAAQASAAAAAAARSRAAVYGSDSDDEEAARTSAAGSHGNRRHGSATSHAPTTAPPSAASTAAAAARSRAQVYGSDSDEDVPAAATTASGNNRRSSGGNAHYVPPTAQAEEYHGTLCGDDPPEAVISVAVVHSTEDAHPVVHATYIV